MFPIFGQILPYSWQVLLFLRSALASIGLGWKGCGEANSFLAATKKKSFLNCNWHQVLLGFFADASVVLVGLRQDDEHHLAEVVTQRPA
jgi:hypothetical protein